MPIYEYEPDGKGCEECRGGFEAIQTFDEAPIEKCPHCGKACHRVFSAFGLGKAEAKMKEPDMSNDNLGRLGFTKYEKKGSGYYEKTAGAGPKTIERDSE